jgi:tetratricopeptide (TPR) repeat protein
MKAFTQAQAAFNEENFAEAARLLEKAYLIEPTPELLYPWAQAERSQGNCDVAIDLYQQFLDSGVEGKFAEAAEQNIERCREEMAEDGGAVVEDDPVGEVIEDEPEPERKPERKEDEPKVRDGKARKWYADPAGGVLFALGLAGAGVGGGLLGVAMSTADKAPDAATNEDYVAERDRATNFRNGGAAALSIGGALLVAAVIRYALLARKLKKETAALRWNGPVVTVRF